MCVKRWLQKKLSQNLEKRNMPRFFNIEEIKGVETLAASGGIFQILILYVVNTKNFV